MLCFPGRKTGLDVQEVNCTRYIKGEIMLIFEDIATENASIPLLKKPRVKRAKVPGGWFVLITQPAVRGSFFYPDPEHQWDGSSLPQN